MTTRTPLCILALGVCWSSAALAEPTPKTAADPIKAIRDTQLELHPRAYFIRRDYRTQPDQQSLAVGGWIQADTLPWRGISVRLAGYTSQPLGNNPKDEGGGDVLQADQDGYSVLAQAHLQLELGCNTLRLYRQIIETPLLNAFDIKMTPVTFEAYTLENTSIANTRLTLSHVRRIKEWTASSFRSLTEAAGYADTDEPMTFGGWVWTPGSNTTMQAWNYYTCEYLNSFYAQGDWAFDLPEDFNLLVSAQYLRQQDVGDAIGGDIGTGMAGGQLALNWRQLQLLGAVTGTRQAGDIVNPWASYPGFTSIVEEDNDLAGERAGTLGLVFNSDSGLGCINFATYHTATYVPPLGNSGIDQWEHDFTLNYTFPGRLKALSIMLRAVFMDADKELPKEDIEDYRVVLNYSITRY